MKNPEISGNDRKAEQSADTMGSPRQSGLLEDLEYENEHLLQVQLSRVSLHDQLVVAGARATSLEQSNSKMTEAVQLEVESLRKQLRRAKMAELEARASMGEIPKLQSKISELEAELKSANRTIAEWKQTIDGNSWGNLLSHALCSAQGRDHALCSGQGRDQGPANLHHS